MTDQGKSTAFIVGAGLFIAWGFLKPEYKSRLFKFANETIENILASPITVPVPLLPPPPSYPVTVRTIEPTTGEVVQVGSRLASSIAALDRIGANVPAPLPEVVKRPSISELLWQRVLGPQAVVLIAGKRGSGKTALAYSLAELCRYRIPPYIVGAPDAVHAQLPEWIGRVSSVEDVPIKAMAIFDEAHSQFHSRNSQAKASKRVSELVNESRHRAQTLMFISQETRQVDRNIASSANVVIFKEPGILQAEFERPELRRIAEKARAEFDGVKGDRRRWSYVWAPDIDFAGMVENPEPSFWSNKLSTAYAGGTSSTSDHHPTKVTLSARKARAKELKCLGWSYREIADAIDVSKSTAINYVLGYKRRSD